MHSVVPGRLPVSNQLSQLLSNQPVEGPLSPLPNEWNTNPIGLARQAILISQLSSQSIERSRTAISYIEDLRFQIDVSFDVPRLSYKFIDWTDQPLILGGLSLFQTFLILCIFRSANQ